MKTMREKSRIVVFLILIFGLTVASLVKKPIVFSENENRYLAQMPKFTLEGLFDGEFTQDYETFITDQFVWRDKWITAKTAVERLMLRKDINGVYFGKDDYLMEKHDNKTFGTEQAQKNANNLVAFLEKYSEQFTPEQLQVVLIPTASQVLSEKLPLFAAPYNQSEYVADILEKVQDEYVLDAEGLLSEHKAEYIYYRTDHHWTSLGAFYTYQAWCERMGLDAYEMDDFEIEEATTEFLGTLDSKVNMTLKPDSMYLYHLKDSVAKIEYSLMYDRNPKDIRDTLYHYAGLEGKDKYTVYMGGNYGEVDIQTNVKNGKTLLVVKDSFAHTFVPLVANHYERILMVDLRYFNLPLSAYIDQNEVTDVLVLYNLANLATDQNFGKIVR